MTAPKKDVKFSLVVLPSLVQRLKRGEERSQSFLQRRPSSFSIRTHFELPHRFIPSGLASRTRLSRNSDLGRCEV